MAETVRLNLHLSPEAERTLSDLARETGASKSDVIRRSLLLLQLVQSTRAEGRHIGFVKDRSKLDTEIIGPW